MTKDILTSLIETYPNFPVKGINFKDISPILENEKAFHFAIDQMLHLIDLSQCDYFVAIDARGFLFASAMAYAAHKGLIMARKSRKLPGELLTQAYNYEYSEAELAIQKSRLHQGKNYIIIDDVLATGNTVAAVGKMIQNAGANFSGLVVFAELEFLKGRDNVQEQTTIESQNIYSLITL